MQPAQVRNDETVSVSTDGTTAEHAQPGRRRPLTARQRQVYDFILNTRRANGIAPSLQEISDHFGFNSKTASRDHLLALVRKGWLRREPSPFRGLVPVDACPWCGR